MNNWKRKRKPTKAEADLAIAAHWGGDMTDKLTDGQRVAVINLLNTCTGIRDKESRLAVLSRILNRPIASLNDLNRSDWTGIRGSAWPNWVNNDWTIGDSFKSRVRSIMMEIRREAGQMEMFV